MATSVQTGPQPPSIPTAAQRIFRSTSPLSPRRRRSTTPSGKPSCIVRYVLPIHTRASISLPAIRRCRTSSRFSVQKRRIYSATQSPVASVTACSTTLLSRRDGATAHHALSISSPRVSPAATSTLGCISLQPIERGLVSKLSSPTTARTIHTSGCSTERGMTIGKPISR